MTKKTVLIVLIGLVVIGIGSYFAASGSDSAMMEKESAAVPAVNPAMDAMDTSVAKDAMVKDVDGAAMMKDESKMMTGDNTKDAMKKDGSAVDETMKSDGGAMMHKGSYEAYAAEKLALANTGDVVLFFRASWCPTCKSVDADIRSHMSAIPEGLTILDVNYDDSTALKKKYGVTYQHTFVQVAADGSLIKKWSASPTLAAIVAEVQ